MKSLVNNDVPPFSRVRREGGSFYFEPPVLARAEPVFLLPQPALDFTTLPHRSFVPCETIETIETIYRVRARVLRNGMTINVSAYVTLTLDDINEFYDGFRAVLLHGFSFIIETEDGRVVWFGRGERD